MGFKTTDFKKLLPNSFNCNANLTVKYVVLILNKIVQH